MLAGIAHLDAGVASLRGIGTRCVDPIGVAERLDPGDELARLLYGRHPQFFSSRSPDLTIPAVTVGGSVALPVDAADPQGRPQPNSGAGVLGD